MDKKATLPIHLQPGSKNNEIVGDRGGVLWVRVKALPVHDKANEALVELMAETLGVPKADLSLIRGHASRDKVLSIRGLDSTELEKRLTPVPLSGSDSGKTRH